MFNSFVLVENNRIQNLITTLYSSKMSSYLTGNEFFFFAKKKTVIVLISVACFQRWLVTWLVLSSGDEGRLVEKVLVHLMHTFIMSSIYSCLTGINWFLVSAGEIQFKDHLIHL